MSIVDFEVHLDQSENIQLENQINENEMKTVNKVLPFETKEVARVILKQGWKLKSKFKLTMNVPDKDMQYNYIEQDEINIRNLEEAFRKYYDNLPLEIMSKDEIENELNVQKINFLDLDFLPNDDTIVNPRYGENMKDIFDYVIHWRRPHEFCLGDNINEDENKEIQIFNYQDVEPNDIQQGILPDNHLASSLSALAEKGNLIKRLFKTDKYSSFGVYQVKLCINGEWNTITIDDYFPCIPKNNPLVSRSPGNEIWVLILEKAIAKVYESYYSLIHINISDFFLLLTGCPSFHLNLEDLIKNDGYDQCMKRLKSFVNDKKYLVVALSRQSENDQNEGEEDDDMLTIGNYGYTLLDVKNMQSDNLVFLRKIWFDQKKEEKIRMYEEQLKKQYPKIESNEGQLILNYEDFLKEFQSVTVCYTKNWEEVRIRGKFVAVNEQDSKSETILSKWYYSITVEKQTTVIISLHQDEDRMKDQDSKKQIMDISISILKQDTNLNEITHIESLDFTIAPNAQLEINLPPGNFIILPRTTGCFFGRPYEKMSDETVAELYNYEANQPSPIFISTIKDIFKKFDMLLNRELKFSEFKGFWECITNNPISKEEFDEGILGKFTSSSEGITEKGFISFFVENLLTGGEKQIWSWLENLGYDQGLYPLRSRCFMLTFHSDNALAVAVRDALNTDLNNKTNKLILKSQGEEKKSSTSSEITALEFCSKTNVISVGVQNRSNITQRVALDFSKAKNLLFSTKTSKVEKVISPGQYDFFMHFYLLADDTGRNNENLNYNMVITPLK
eukprot:CAMPEP_0170517410 /NCGR_PEP_ID=MMETSP0209-20121228/3415_1 /TAXON_ID=665100 ORGANISM="Litonotus pictus, Strain P1" /NCGR_SAMPLE_ID=MMETSP0209 /ASSEMBLY_ACC=CAM_ASM_000301 /LENGTH=788 /DNA_ID=CAMNT_0010802657 /DNA_START=138 /DNA_END=2504 /DNA_ORIENTATION=+